MSGKTPPSSFLPIQSCSRRFLLSCLLLALGASAVVPEALAAEPVTARITRVRGPDVQVRSSAEDKVSPAKTGMSLKPGDEVKTGAGSDAEILLGTESLVSIRENSLFKLPGVGEEKASFLLRVGTMLFKIKKASGEGLRVVTPSAVAAVRGTEFAVEVSSAGSKTLVGVFDEGRVAASTDAGEVELRPGQETACVSGAAPEPPRPLKALLKYRAVMRTLRARLEDLKRESRNQPQEKRRELQRKLRGKPKTE